MCIPANLDGALLHWLYTFRKHTKEEQMQYFHLIYDFLTWQASSGGPFSGALFWNAAIGDYAYDDGYNIYLDVVSEPEPVPAEPFPAAIDPAACIKKNLLACKIAGASSKRLKF
eukprot:1155150-Pelagomonas_calceolata.AAC.20